MSDQQNSEGDVSLTVPRPIDGTTCIEVVDDESVRYFVLKNSQKHAYLRLDEKGRFLWEQMDGKANLSDIAGRYYEEYQALGFDRIGQIYQQSQAQGFLEEGSKDIGERMETLEPTGWLQKVERTLHSIAFKPIGRPVDDAFFEKLKFLPSLGKSRVLWVLGLIGAAGLAIFFQAILEKGSGAFQALHPGGHYSLALISLYIWLSIGSFVNHTFRAAALKAAGCEVVGAGLAFRFGVFGAHVDIADYQILPRGNRRVILLSGVLAQLFMLGLFGFLSTSGIPELFRELFALGTLVIGARFFFHACPFFHSEIYRVVSEAFNIQHLRQAAFRFLRPRYWLRIWAKKKWETQEIVFLLFGVWSIGWVTAAAKLSSFLMRSQLLDTILDLITRAASGSAKFSADEIAALLMVLMTLLPIVMFLPLSIIYAAVSLYRVVPRMEVWKRPSMITVAFAAVSALVGFLAWVSLGTALELVFRTVVAVGGIYLAKILLTTTRRQFASPFGSKISLVLFFGGSGAALVLAGALLDSMDLLSVASKVSALGTGLCALGFFMILPVQRQTLTTQFKLPWVALFFALLGCAGFGACSLLEAQWLTFAMAFGFLFVTAGWGWWYTAANHPFNIPPYQYADSDNNLQLFHRAFNYSMTALLVNLKDYGGSKFLNALCKGLEAKAKASGLEVSAKPDGPFEWAISKQGDFDTMAAHLKEIVLQAIEGGTSVCGRDAMIRLLRTIYKNVPWEERELLGFHIFRGTDWGDILSQGQDVPKTNRVELLGGTFLFQHFNQEELSRIASVVESRTYQPSEFIIQQDDEGDEAYVIQNGHVGVLVENEMGETHAVAELHPGDFFGELSLLEDVPRSATIRALSQVEVLILDRPIFDRFVERYGGAREKLGEAIRALRVIQRMPLFDDFTAEEVATVATKFRVEHFQKGENVITEGETGSKFYVVQKGNAEVMVGEGDKNEVLGNLKPGEFFGEIALLLDVPRTATVQATDEMTVFSLDKSDFLQLLGGNPFARRKLQVESERRTTVIKTKASA